LEARVSSNLYMVTSWYNLIMLFCFGQNSDGGPSTGVIYTKKITIFGQ